MIFDYYPRPDRLDVTNAKSVVATCAFNGFRMHGGGLALTKFSEQIPFGKLKGAVFILSKPVPEAFTISGTPNPNVAGNGSYSFTPTVVGGVRPYVFELDGDLESGFVFNAATGTLSRPPQ